MKPEKDEFYVGYMPHAPQSLSKWLRSRVGLLLVVPLVVGAVMVLEQNAFGPGVFEFQVNRDFEGTILAAPAPALLLDRPGNAGERVSLYYLVEFGKKGGKEAVAAFVGKKVKLRGALLYRDNQTMIQLEKGAASIQVLDKPGQKPQHTALGSVTLQGEIVDSKCYLGLMKPGNLKPHKACAINCIAGGIPPVLLVRNGTGDARYLLLVSETGASVNQAVLDWVAEPIEITGQLEQWGDMLVLKADPKTYRKPKI